VADLNDDGVLDVVAVGNVEDVVMWYEGPAWTPHTIDGSLDVAVALQAADMDGDGDFDVVVAAEEGSDLILLYKNLLIDALDDDYSVQPYKVELYQNYPNPFNPNTTIEYQLPTISGVDLSIYNLLGQKVATLVSTKQHAGKYDVEWDATGFASGVYLYRLETDKGFTQTKKLILMK